ncbi:hypothetical protein [Actinoplanes teichomyceticus]|uniref:DNRLRE domain-containing protein n=1 Tax=Actinoplanes teichomyceticus TaxID=1867 RepID=A0A561WIE4_ACTTI|nr:hypothetical protein [Actinoplanes teichomyceticus]TWG23625.1 hypothetical protein FHX34_102174 [Actinoplanes teichomyceticus]GIF11664.1 hypothetical protein Ate01nite_16960 [Actinoplanes teichomyceticus]
MHRCVRALLAAAAATLSATTVLAGLATPAQAMNYDSADLTTWTYLDKARPSTPNPNPSGDYLIGTSRDADGVQHTGRAFFTYDLTPLKGQVLHRVTFYTSERTVNSCARTAPIQVWRTRPVTATTTWQRPPRELELLAERAHGKGVICPGAYLDVDMLPQVQAALARGEKSLTVEVRLAAGAEADAELGRTMRQAGLSWAANHAPKVSGLKLKYPDAGCGTPARHPSAGTWMQADATVTDADPLDYARRWFAYWPVDHPDQRRETTSPSFDLSGFDEGTVVAWSAQGRDYDDAGPWGRTCYFTVDRTAPTTRPLVSSRQYPTDDHPGTGGPGVPGTFVFDAGGDLEVTGFDWSALDGGLVQHVVANHPGGRGKVSITPRMRGTGRLEVAAVDAAGNRGPWVRYEYEVRNTAPSATIDVRGVGLTSHITLHSAAAEATGFGYAVDGGPEKRVPAVNGTGEDDLVFDSTGVKTVVTRTYAGRKMIGSDTQSISVSDAPAISSEQFGWMHSPVAGRPGSFTFAPRTTGVVAYLYDLERDFGGPGEQQRVDAAADGAAVLNWTPEQGGHYRIRVSSVDAGGNRSQLAEESFRVIDTHPNVYANTWGAHVGDPISVSVSSELPDVTGMVYRFDGGPQTTVDGAYVSVDVVPTHAGDSVFTAWARLSDGTLSPPTEYTLHLDSAPQLTVRGPFGDERLVHNRPASFTFTSALAGATAFRYSFDNPYDDRDAEERTVAAGADGTATITLDVPEDWNYSIEARVVSVAADGAASDPRSVSLSADSPRVEVENPWPADWAEPAGGLGVPGQFGFYAYTLGDVTARYLWRVDDGPLHEAPVEADAWMTSVAYTPDRTGAHTLYVQREFTDGSVSPAVAVPFTVGTRPLITSDRYPADTEAGAPGTAGTFRFSGGTAGVVSYDYAFVPDGGAPVLAGTVDAADDGSAQVTFTPSAAGAYTALVTGRTADGTRTTQAGHRFTVSHS